MSSSVERGSSSDSSTRPALMLSTCTIAVVRSSTSNRSPTTARSTWGFTTIRSSGPMGASSTGFSENCRTPALSPHVRQGTSGASGVGGRGGPSAADVAPRRNRSRKRPMGPGVSPSAPRDGPSAKEVLDRGRGSRLSSPERPPTRAPARGSRRVTDELHSPPDGTTSRRTMLKGAAVGAGAVLVAPSVLTLGATPAAASPAGCNACGQNMMIGTTTPGTGQNFGDGTATALAGWTRSRTSAATDALPGDGATFGEDRYGYLQPGPSPRSARRGSRRRPPSASSLRAGSLSARRFSGAAASVHRRPGLPGRRERP